MKKLTMTGLGIGMALALGTTAFAEQACGGKLFNGKCFEKLEPVDCYLVPFIFDDNENVIGGGGLLCTSAASNDTPPIIVKQKDLRTVPDGKGGVTTYYAAKKVVKFKAGAARPDTKTKAKKKLKNKFKKKKYLD